MPLRVPPPEIPVVTFLSPNKADQGLIEFWNTLVASYTPLDIGASHPNSRQYPGFTLGKQAPVQGDEKWIIRTWVTPETSPDWFNWAEKYSAEDNAYPIFVRTYRELKSTYTPRAKQSTLGTLYKIVVEDVGSGYAQGALPTITFDTQVPAPDSVAIGHGVVAPDGTISECVIDFGGEGYVENISFRVEDPLSGNPASGTAYIQPQGAILVKEEANQYPPDSEFYAQYLQVTRIYETLPGPTLYSTKLDIDGAILTTGVTRKLCADITTGEDINGGIWTRTTKRSTDIDFVCEEVVETRAIPGITMESTKIDEDGKVITRQQTYVATSAIVSSETIVAGVWIKKFQEDVDGTSIVSWQIVEERDVPGNPIPYTRLDDDGKAVSGIRTLKDQSTIVTVESLIGGVWTHTFKERVTDLVSWEVTESRDIPGNPVISTKIDEDGVAIAITKTLGDTSTIVSDEVVAGGFWVRTYKEEVSDLVAYQVQETRAVPGNPIAEYKIDDDGKVIETVRTLKEASTITPSESIVGVTWVKVESKAVSDLVAWEIVTARASTGNDIPSNLVDDDHEIANITRKFREEGDITPSATESGGFIETVEKKEIGDLVSWEIRTNKRWLDKAEFQISIINLIPREFMAFVPTFTESHILAGTSSMPTLGAGEFEHSKRQLTRLLYEERIVSLGSVSLPITHTNQETTEEYGGGVLNVTYILETQGTGLIDEGLLITESTLTDLGNGMEVKLTKQLNDTVWPVLYSRLWDENMRVEYDETRQVVDAGTSEDPDPGGGFAWMSEVKGIDKWRSLIINTAKPAPAYDSSANALITYKMEPFRFPGFLLWSGNGYYTRGATAVLVLHTIRTWWVKSGTTPTVGATGSGADVEFDEIVTDDVIINNLANTGLEYARNVLHDGITVGLITFPATTPSATEYYLGTVTGSSVLDLIGLFANGSGYLLGDSLSFSGDGGSASVDLTAIGIGGSVFQWTPNGGSFGWTPAGYFGPYAASGGAGTGAEFYVIAADVPTYDPSTKWVGTEHVIGASVTPEKEKDIFKIQTESIVMR